jgi:dihydrofolate reductase
MPTVIAAFNMTLDGNSDHTAGTPDEEVHQHYTDLLNAGGTILYGRTTYQLMEDYWPSLVKTPGPDKAYNDFALAIDRIDKVLFSRTVKSVDWNNSRLSNKSLAEEIASLKQSSGKDIYIGSRSLIIQALNQNLVDEFQILIHPSIEGKGPRLFEEIESRIKLKLQSTKTFKASGVVALYYQPER